MKELVTILLPTYNGQKYIVQMLESIYLQDYRPIEVIISDDASTDRTRLVIKHWLQGKKDESITFKLIKNRKNIGLSGNISKAEKYVHGKFVFLADQDDIWKSNKISAQVGYLERNDDCVMCICDKAIINEHNEIMCTSTFKHNSTNLQKRDYMKVFNSRANYPANSMCLRAEHLDKIFPIPPQMSEHDVFIAIMAAHFGKIGFLKRSLTLYRIHSSNLSAQYSLETSRNPFIAGYKIFKSFKRKNFRENNDPPIIKKELEQRFGEINIKFSKALYPGAVENIYIETLKYMINNLNRLNLFGKNIHA